MRSPNLYADPATVLDVYGYDARTHADEAVKFFLEQRVLVDDSTDVTRKEADKIVNWFLPNGESFWCHQSHKIPGIYLGI